MLGKMGRFTLIEAIPLGLKIWTYMTHQSILVGALTKQNKVDRLPANHMALGVQEYELFRSMATMLGTWLSKETTFMWYGNLTECAHEAEQFKLGRKVRKSSAAKENNGEPSNDKPDETPEKAKTAKEDSDEPSNDKPDETPEKAKT